MVQIRLKHIIDEDFQDYKKPSMMLATCYCDWKCLTEKSLDLSICQNSELAHQDNIEVSIDSIIERYLNNPITKAIVIAGLEPFLQFAEVIRFINEFREVREDDIVIYTGYYLDEIDIFVNELSDYKNIIIKFGRYIPNNEGIYDEVLGVRLASDNQFAVKIS